MTARVIEKGIEEAAPAGESRKATTAFAHVTGS
jgi:hypothetical protein